MYFMKFFLLILCPFTSHLHAPLTQLRTNPSIPKKRLFDTDSRPFSFPFKFDPTLTLHHLQSSIVCNTVFFLDLSILLKTSLYTQYLHIKVVAFAEEEIGASRESFSTKYSRVSTNRKWKAFKIIMEEGEKDG